MPTKQPEAMTKNDIDRKASELIRSVEEVQRKASQHDEIRATLLVNFSKKRGEKIGLVLKDEGSTSSLLVQVLEFFIDQCKAKEERYCLISDGDGHWFMAPADKREEANLYFEKLGEFWDSPEEERREMPEEPEWLRACNGPHTLVFSNPEDDFS